MKYDNNALKMIEELSNAKGPSGFEDEVLEAARKYTEFLDVSEDKLRNLYLYRKKNTGNKPVLMLDAHSDEVGFMVHSIKPDGTLRVMTLGRWTNSTLPASKIKVKNAEGKWISGVFVCKPVHFKSEAEKNMGEPPIGALAIDIGATSKKEAEEIFKIRIGEPVVPATRFEFDEENGLMFSKAFDCRIGCAALIETLRRIDDLDLEVDVVGVLSSQEEVGERGATVAVNHIKPDVAICFEGCPADDTFQEAYAIQTALKKGPMFRHMDISCICSPGLQRFVLDLAHEKKMPVQESVREGGGNNAAVINPYGNGVPVVTAGVPVRYIHAMNCIASYDDFEYTVSLIVEIIKNLNKEVIDKF